MERNIPNIIGLKQIHIQGIFKLFRDIFKLSFPQKVQKVGKTEILITIDNNLWWNSNVIRRMPKLQYKFMSFYIKLNFKFLRTPFYTEHLWTTASKWNTDSMTCFSGTAESKS